MLKINECKKKEHGNGGKQSEKGITPGFMGEYQLII
jgi:hypothetical protein